MLFRDNGTSRHDATRSPDVSIGNGSVAVGPDSQRQHVRVDRAPLRPFRHASSRWPRRILSGEPVAGEFPIVSPRCPNELACGHSGRNSRGPESVLRIPRWVNHGRSTQHRSIGRHTSRPLQLPGCLRRAHTLTPPSASDRALDSATASDTNGHSPAQHPQAGAGPAYAPSAPHERDDHCSNAGTQGASAPDRRPSRRGCDPSIPVESCQ